MTREEAIEILLDMANELQLIPESKQGQAFKVAIKALEQEPCEDKLYDIFSRIIDDMYNELSSVKPQEPILDKIRAEIEQAANKQFKIAMGIADLNERYTHIQMENAYRHSLNIIDKYRGEEDETDN